MPLLTSFSQFIHPDIIESHLFSFLNTYEIKILQNIPFNEWSHEERIGWYIDHLQHYNENTMALFRSQLPSDEPINIYRLHGFRAAIQQKSVSLLQTITRVWDMFDFQCLSFTSFKFEYDYLSDIFCLLGKTNDFYFICSYLEEFINFSSLLHFIYAIVEGLPYPTDYESDLDLEGTDSIPMIHVRSNSHFLKQFRKQDPLSMHSYLSAIAEKNENLNWHH